MEPAYFARRAGKPGGVDHAGVDRRPDAGNRSFGLCLRHLLPGLGPSAPVAAAGPVQFSTEFNSGPLAGVLRAPQRARGDQEAVTIIAWSVEWMR